MHASEEIGTALHIAIIGSRDTIVPLLLSFRSIDINIRHPITDLPLVYTVMQWNNKVLAALDRKPYIEAIARHLLACQDRIRVNLPSKDGETPLALACRFGAFEIVRMLLSCPNININTRDTLFQRTPLHEAVTVRCVESIKLLVQDPKCDINVQDKEGRTPLHLIAASYHVTKQAVEIVKAFVKDPTKCDINLNVQDKEGRTPLHSIVLARNSYTAEEVQNQYECVRILAAVPTINFSLKDNKNMTVVDLAMRYGYSMVRKEIGKYKDRFDETVRKNYNL